MQTSVGSRDARGNLLILGGHQANLWQLANGLYSVAGNVTIDPVQAAKLYNEYNGSSLREDYIGEVFAPWYAQQFAVVVNVPSSSNPNKTYAVKRGPGGALTCECPGYIYRHECWHIKAVEELISDEP